MLIHYQLREGKGYFSGGVNQPTYVIRMRMSQKDRIDVVRLNPSKSKVRFQLASPLPDSSCAGVNQNRPATASN